MTSKCRYDLERLTGIKTASPHMSRLENGRRVTWSVRIDSQYLPWIADYEDITAELDGEEGVDIEADLQQNLGFTDEIFNIVNVEDD